MTSLRVRRTDPELLDGPLHPPEELCRSLGQVAAVNRWLGGERSLRHHLAPLRASGQPLRILDVGTGSGTVASRILRWGRAAGAEWSGVGVDHHPQVLAVARRNALAAPLRLVRAGALTLPFAARSFDVSLCTLTLHHFTDADAARVLSELGRVTRTLVLVSDLERRVLAYLAARVLSLTWWRRNRLTRNDGPLSVLRAFTPGELLELGQKGGLARARIRRHFPFRLVLEARP